MRSEWDLGGIGSFLKLGGDYAADLSGYYLEELVTPGGATMKVLRNRKRPRDPDIAEVLDCPSGVGFRLLPECYRYPNL
jgi:hypothetical protein